MKIPSQGHKLFQDSDLLADHNKCHKQTKDDLEKKITWQASLQILDKKLWSFRDALFLKGYWFKVIFICFINHEMRVLLFRFTLICGRIYCVSIVCYQYSKLNLLRCKKCH